MTYPADSAANRIALVKQLYDEWGGHYAVMRLIDGRYVPQRDLTREQAMVYRCKSDEALQIVRPRGRRRDALDKM